jgi:hypothetical protein
MVSVNSSPTGKLINFRSVYFKEVRDNSFFNSNEFCFICIEVPKHALEANWMFDDVKTGFLGGSCAQMFGFKRPKENNKFFVMQNCKQVLAGNRCGSCSQKSVVIIRTLDDVEIMPAIMQITEHEEPNCRIVANMQRIHAA